MTKEQIHILQHSLGVDEYGRGQMYRNHFCAGGKDEELCRELVAVGLMWTWPNADENGRVPGYPYFNCSVTDKGKSAMLAESPKPPKLSRSQARYRRFLAEDTGESFKEWLISRPGSSAPLPSAHLGAQPAPVLSSEEV